MKNSLKSNHRGLDNDMKKGYKKILVIIIQSDNKDTQKIDRLLTILTIISTIVTIIVTLVDR